MTQPESIAWAAGLFEGEGWISVQRTSPLIGIQMSDKEVLERFMSIVGCGKIYYRKPRVYSYEKINARKEQWAWRLSNKEQVKQILGIFRPWLSSRRNKRADEVLAIAATGQIKPGMPKGYKTKKVLDCPCGEVRKYWRGCRCPECRVANSSYSASRKQTKSENTLPA